MANVGETILSQLGGRRFIAFTGAKNFTTNGENLCFKIGRNSSKANYVRITLNAMDLYDIEFIKFTPMKIDYKKCEVRNKKIEVLETFSDIYCDQLQEVFTSYTGLYTHF